MDPISLLAIRHAVGYPGTDDRGLCRLIDEGIGPGAFRRFEGGEVVPTGGGLAFEVARDYYLRYAALVPPSACADLITASSASDALTLHANEALSSAAGLPYEPDDAARIARELLERERQALFFGHLASERLRLQDVSTFSQSLDRLLAAGDRLRSNGRVEPYVTLESLAPLRIERMRALREDPTAAHGVTVGIAGFDLDTLGLFAGEMLTLVGEEKVGKSLLLLHIMAHIWTSGRNVALALREMPAELELRRLEAMLMSQAGDECPRLMTRLKAGTLDDGQMTLYEGIWGAVGERAHHFALISPSHCATLDQLERALHQFSRSCTIHALGIDSGQEQRLGSEGRALTGPDRQREVAQRILDLGSRYDCPVIVDLQWRRDAPPSEGLSGIGLSKAWGERTTYALMISRPDTYRMRLQMIGSRDSEIDTTYELIVDPHRMYVVNPGPLGEPIHDGDNT